MSIRHGWYAWLVHINQNYKVKEGFIDNGMHGQVTRCRRIGKGGYNIGYSRFSFRRKVTKGAVGFAIMRVRAIFHIITLACLRLEELELMDTSIEYTHLLLVLQLKTGSIWKNQCICTSLVSKCCHQRSNI